MGGDEDRKFVYRVTLDRGDVIADIFDELGKIYPTMSNDEKSQLARSVIPELRENGNKAVAYGLSLVGVKIIQRNLEKK